MVFELDAFVGACRESLGARNAAEIVRDAVARAVSNRSRLLASIGEPKEAGITPLYRAADLTILNVVWSPKMALLPHDHAMWAVIGIYGGREDNIFWKRVPGSPDGRVEAAGAKSLGERDTVILGPDIIHSIANPIAKLTGSLHVYGGDFYEADRHEWDPETLDERPYDFARNTRLFAEENARLAAYGGNENPNAR